MHSIHNAECLWELCGLVPNRAVKTQARNRVVDVESAGKIESRRVTIGLSNDQMTEIVEGLQDGEVVVIQTTTTAPARVPVMGGPGLMVPVPKR
ncbi:MAG: hypothetical protein HY675_25285 [Chloroflexi bacterium]|nr:hypothetical protein [Chloroflexota bacterium]